MTKASNPAKRIGETCKTCGERLYLVLGPFEEGTRYGKVGCAACKSRVRWEPWPDYQTIIYNGICARACSCGVPIIFRTYKDKDGKQHNRCLEAIPITVATPDMLSTELRFVPHHAYCPDRKKYRKKKATKTNKAPAQAKEAPIFPEADDNDVPF